MQKTQEFKRVYLDRDDLCVGTPTSPAKASAEKGEARVERILIRDNMRSFMNNELLNINVNRFYNQLPASLFMNDDACDDTKIFPSDGARIDMWGLEGSTIHIMELKTGENSDLGVLSELFYYACFINDMYCIRHLERKDPPNLQQYDLYKHERGYFKLKDANVDSVKAHFLLEREHRHFDVAFKELQKCEIEGIQFLKASYPFSQL